MSIKENLFVQIDNTISSFIAVVAKKYNLDSNQLYELWSGASGQSENKEPLIKIDMTDLSRGRLIKCSKPELVALCKTKGVKCSGKKDELIDRLCGTEPAEDGEIKEFKAATKATSTRGKKTTDDVKEKAVPVIKKLLAKIPDLNVRRNAYNNFEHAETGLVFDPKEKIVIGRQDDNGTVVDLTDDDIQLCKKFKFKWKTPFNLDSKDTNEKIAGLDDDEDVVVEVSDIDADAEEESDEDVEVEDS